jgi:tetraacyldisaccharide 4'-kinase
LDDGFQYWELDRNLDIVLIDSRNPFGNSNLFPRGTLRETKHAIVRADVIVLTKVNKKLCDMPFLKNELKQINPDLIFVEAYHKPLYLYNAKSRRIFDLNFARGKRVVLISSIGDPEYFMRTVEDLKTDVIEHIVFADHHNYESADVERIMRVLSERSFDFIVTTEKDTVKFNRMSHNFGSYSVMTLIVDMEIVSGKERLLDRLHSLYSR